jgi:phosphoenolpyruvate carboxylase
VNITGSIEEVISTSTSATVDYVTTGATITDFLASSNQSKDSNIAKVTLEELVGDFSITADDVNSIRKSRSLLSAGELNKSEFIRRKIRELRVVS